MTHFQETGYRFSPARTEVKRPLIHVHANELVRLFGVQIAPILQGVGKCFLPVPEPILDAGMQQSLYLCDRLGAEVLPDGIGSQRQWPTG